MLTPAIVIVAYNRPAALQRLLHSLLPADYGGASVPLLISIDHGGTPAVRAVAEQFEWPYGPKTLLARAQNLGLKAHVYACADLSQDYGALIMLEDDLYVSPHFYAYARAALARYAETPSVAGISLYSYRLTEHTLGPFEPMDDGTDAYFMQVPSSWGQAWTAAQWAAYRAWQAEGRSAALPHYIAKWSARSWKREYAQYLIDRDAYILYPRWGLSTNFGEAGSHFKGQLDRYQSQLQAAPRDYRWPAFAHAACYDAFFEPHPAWLAGQPDLAGLDLAIDLHGGKLRADVPNAWVLSTQPLRRAERHFALALRPPLANVLAGLPGRGIALGRAADLRQPRVVDWLNRWRPYHYNRAKLRRKWQAWWGA